MYRRHALFCFVLLLLTALSLGPAAEAVSMTGMQGQTMAMTGDMGDCPESGECSDAKMACAVTVCNGLAGLVPQVTAILPIASVELNTATAGFLYQRYSTPEPYPPRNLINV